MKSDMDKIAEMFIGMDINGSFREVLLREDFDKIYRRYGIMDKPLSEERIDFLEDRAIGNENNSQLQSMVHQLIASHRLLRKEIADEQAKTNIFKQKMESIVKEL